MRLKIVIAAAVWWLILASLSQMEISPLQQVWTFESKLAIFLYFPACIVVGGVIAVILSKQINLNVKVELIKFPVTERVFYTLMLVFFAQCLIFIPPALSSVPGDARLDWGFPIIHVLTEIIIRVMCLIVVGNVCVRKRITAHERWILIASVVYTILVVSRSFMLEIIFYWGLASLVCSFGKTTKISNILKYAGLLFVIFGVFIGYGNWRQASDFSIVDYGEVLIDSNALAWVFGYFLVNFDNLALLINENFRNDSFSNILGSILQTLQIQKYENVDDYLYVGKFNLGTAIRPFVLDFGAWVGGATFIVLWAFFLITSSWCKKPSTHYAVLMLITYSAFCFPITGRIEQPPYLFSLIWILMADRLVLFRRSKPKVADQ
jgi:hypothetical protein